MRLQAIATLFILSLVTSKNVLNMEKFENLKGNQKEKREAKNVADLKLFESHVKRDGNEQMVLNNKNNNEIKNIEFINGFLRTDEQNSYRSLLESVLPQIREISIFASYIRDDSILCEKTESTSEMMLIIAPLDSAIYEKLDGYKPWEFPDPLSDDDGQNEKIIQKNLRNFVDGHIVLNFEKNIKLNDDKSLSTNLENGKSITFKQEGESGQYNFSVDNGAWITTNSVIKVENGFVFVINEVLVKNT